MQKTSGRSRRNLGDGGSSGLQALDRIDRQILKRLQQDGRLTITQLAREVHLTVTPCLERVRRLEALGYIKGYFAHLDPGRLGLGLLAYITINMQQTSSGAFDRFKTSMMSCEEVMECHMVGGGFDYLLKVRVKDVSAFREFLTERLANTDGVHQTHTYFVLEEIKSSHQLAVQG
jgi:Lrp/AsnC family transcriptional regulator, leucine-responsive regulatory protein